MSIPLSSIQSTTALPEDFGFLLVYFPSRTLIIFAGFTAQSKSARQPRSFSPVRKALEEIVSQ